MYCKIKVKHNFGKILSWMNPIEDSEEIKLNPFNVLNKQDEGIVDQTLI